MTLSKKQIVLGILMVFFAFMMMEMKYTDALGDLVLSAIGIAPWTNGNSGIHMTVLYFGIPFTICFFALLFSVKELKYTPMLFIFLLLSVTTLTTLGDYVTMFVKGQSGGLDALVVVGEGPMLEISVKDGEVQAFEGAFEIDNFSNQSFEVYITYLDVAGDNYTLLDLEGEPAAFEILPKQVNVFEVSESAYELSDYSGFENGGVSAYHCELLLKSTEDSEEIYISNKSLGLSFAR